jgi:hypothetical protein
MNNATGYFIDYEEATLDPGWSFILGSLIACILLNATLPCLVSLGSRYEMRRNESNNRSSEESTAAGGDSSHYGEQVVLVDIGLVANSRNSKLGELDRNKEPTNPAEAISRVSSTRQQTRSNQLAKVDEASCTTFDESFATVVGDIQTSVITACFGTSLADWFCDVADTVCVGLNRACSLFDVLTPCCVAH